MENPNQRFKTKSNLKDEPDFFVYDIERQSNNIVEREKQEELSKEQVRKKNIARGETDPVDLLKRAVATIIDIGLSIFFILGMVFCFFFVQFLFSAGSLPILEIFNIIWELKWLYIPGLVLMEDFLFLEFSVKLLVIIAQILGASIFFAYFESSEKRATFGKRIMGLKVLKDDLSALDYREAVIRNLLKFTIITIIGLFLEKRRCLHNLWTGAVVKSVKDIHELLKF